jgi:hypothetical protein
MSEAPAGSRPPADFHAHAEKIPCPRCSHLLALAAAESPAGKMNKFGGFPSMLGAATKRGINISK